MTRSFLLLVLAGLLAVQVSAGLKSKLDSPLDAVIEMAKQVLQYVTKLIDLAFEESESILNKLLDKLDDLRVAAVKLAEKQIERQSQLLEKLIETIKNRSDGTNLDILNCLQEIETEAEEVEKNTVNTSMACIDTSIEATGRNILYILEDLQQINADFAKHEAGLDECKGKLFPFQCIKEVVDELGKVALMIPAKIKADAAKATLDFAALGYEIFQCAKNATQRMQEENVKLFNDFSQCVHEKGHPHSTMTY